MGETLIQQCRVGDDGLRVVKPFWWERKAEREYRSVLTVPTE